MGCAIYNAGVTGDLGAPQVTGRTAAFYSVGATMAMTNVCVD